jgi:hypothetical protein
MFESKRNKTTTQLSKAARVQRLYSTTTVLNNNYNNKNNNINTNNQKNNRMNNNLNCSMRAHLPAVVA